MQTLRDRNDAVSGVPCDVAGLDINAVLVANCYKRIHMVRPSLAFIRRIEQSCVYSAVDVTLARMMKHPLRLLSACSMTSV